MAELDNGLDGPLLIASGDRDEVGLTFFERTSLIVLGSCVAWTLISSVLFFILRCIMKRAYPESEDVQVNEEDSALATVHNAGAKTYYCFTCADFRTIEDKFQSANEDTGKVRMGMSCSMCGHLMVHYNWLPRLLEFFLEYKAERYNNVSLTFPIADFLSHWDYLTMLLQILSACINITSICYKLGQLPVRDRNIPYNLTLIIVPWLEFIAVCVMLTYIITNCVRVIYGSQHRKFGHVKRSFSVFFSVFLPSFPKLANVNAIGMIRFWDLQNTVRSLFREGTVSTVAPTRVVKALRYLFLLSRIPILVFLCFIPALAIFTRLLQLAGIMQIYVGEWGITEWIVFLGFLNNIRSVANRQNPLACVFQHLVSAHVFHPFIDITIQTGRWWKCACVMYTSPPQELYRLFIDNQDLLYPQSVDKPQPTQALATKLRALKSLAARTDSQAFVRQQTRPKPMRQEESSEENGDTPEQTVRIPGLTGGSRRAMR